MEHTADWIRSVQHLHALLLDSLKTPDHSAAHQFGDFIRKQRLQRKWTAEQLADRCRLSRPAITGLEKGRTTISTTRLERLLEALESEPFEWLPTSERAAIEEEARKGPPTAAVTDRREELRGIAPRTFLRGVLGGQDESSTLRKLSGAMQTTHSHLGSILEGRTEPSSDMLARLAAYLQRSPDDVKAWLRESDWGENLPGASNHLAQEFRNHVSLISTYLTIVWLLSAHAARTWDSLQTVRLPAIQDPRTGQTTTVENPAGLYDYVQKQLAKMSNEQVLHVLEAAGALARIAFTDAEFLQHFREFHEALHPMLPQTQGKLRRDPAADHPESKRKTYFDYLSEDEKDLIRTLIRKLAAHKIEADSE